MTGLMTEEQIANAKARAQAVADGFRTRSEQVARDAVKLAEMLQARNKQVLRLAEEVKKRSGNTPPWMNDLFGDGLFR